MYSGVGGSEGVLVGVDWVGQGGEGIWTVNV